LFQHLAKLPWLWTEPNAMHQPRNCYPVRILHV